MGSLGDGVLIFREMQRRKLAPNRFAFGSVVAGCARVTDARTGVQIHCGAVKFGFEFDTFVSGVLIDMYAKCGEIDDCWKLFDRIPDKDVASWTTMITSLANSEWFLYRNSAFRLLKDMVSSGVMPIGMTFASLVKVFDEPAKLRQAKQAHGLVVKVGIEVDDHLSSALIAMYGRCGAMDEVVRLSSRMNRDVVSLTSLLAAYTHNGRNVEAIQVFRMMVEEEVMIDRFVISSVIRACSAMAEVRMGKELHGYALRRSLVSDVSVGNSLITMYARFGKIWMAAQIFQLMSNRDIISWTAMLTCYTRNNYGEEALSLFRLMLRAGLSPPIFGITGAIRASSHITSLPMGGQLHSQTVRMGINANLSVANSLITMYAKCGNVEDASGVFDSMTERDAVSWNALISGFSYHGFESRALEAFHLMKREGVEPDDYTFFGVLTSCSRAELVAEGQEYLRRMKTEYGLEPKMGHYACVVDMLGRAGRLHEAVEFINRMPCDPGCSVWEALLASCRRYGAVELAKLAATKIVERRAEDASPCVTLSSIHASMGEREACVFFDEMEERGVGKKPGRRWMVQWLKDEEDALQVGGI